MGAYMVNDDDLKQRLLDEVYAGAFCGKMPAMWMDEDRIRKADEKELEKIAKEYGIRR